MKVLLMALAFFLVTCLLLSACGEIHSLAAHSVSNSAAASAPTLEPTITVTPEPTSEEEIVYDYGDVESLNAALAECYSREIELANKCRVNVDGNEYYFDTNKFILMDMDTMDVEFPLYMDSKDKGTVYLGTMGYFFKVCEPYIYVESDVQWEDYPGRETIRIVNLNDLSVTPFGQDVLIYVPDPQGDKVFYNFEIDDCIYVADPSLKTAKKLHIEAPDKDIIEEKIRSSIDDLNEDIRIKEVKEGWIYFNYEVFVYEGGNFYNGNYRIKTNGSKIEKTDEGIFDDEIKNEEG